jgi:hypothetical protein
VEIRLGRLLATNDLDRDDAVQSGVFRAPHLTHAALANPRNYLVRAQPVTRSNG